MTDAALPPAATLDLGAVEALIEALASRGSIGDTATAALTLYRDLYKPYRAGALSAAALQKNGTLKADVKALAYVFNLLSAMLDDPAEAANVNKIVQMLP